MIEKMVIANRGEIASRVVRTARRLGIRSVAVHSEADARALHVGEADERFSTGPAAAHDTELKIEQVLLAARKTGADAVHPGYGWRLESAAFARACRAAGLTYVGAPTGVIEAMSSKLGARALARQTGVPVVPGTEALDSAAAARGAAAALGYPVMLKAAAGGGGIGMQIVRDDAELERHFQSLREKAQRLFGDASVYLEKLLERPLHLQVQLAGDEAGHLVHLGERDCSVQLRHHKLLEEAPAPHVDHAMREELVTAALAIGRALRFSSLGTVELLASGGRFYFLEVNTRLQIEHTVTEMVTGLDLVEWQLRIAMGEELPARQEEIRFRGHAVQCRIHAEDPGRGFAPVGGRITRLLVPRHHGVRNDVGVVQGDVVTPYYDPMIGKLVVHGPDRPSAIERLRRALDDYQVEGVPTNLELLRRIAGDETFAAGETSVDFIRDRMGV